MSSKLHLLPGPEAEEYKVPQEQQNKMVVDKEKIEKKQDGFFDIIKKEINEHNVVLFILFFIYNFKYTNLIIDGILDIYFQNQLLSSIFKSALAVIIYLVFKHYILPNIAL